MRISSANVLVSPFDLGPLKPRDVLETEVDEASDLAILPDGRFAVVSDEKIAISLVDSLGDVTTHEVSGIKKGASGFEALTYDPINKKFLVVSEDKSKLYRYDSHFNLEEKIEVGIEGSDNKGVEGMAWIPAEASPTGKPALLIVKEAEPKRLALLDVSGRGKLIEIELSHALKKSCEDFSGVAYDPVTKHIFICSQVSACLVEVSLSKNGANLIAKHSLRDENGRKLDRVEGIAADENGIYVLTENDGLIHRYSR